MTVAEKPTGLDADGWFRRRLLDGLAASIIDRGYRATTVTDIVGHAQTSKRTFYREFADKHECFIELLGMVNEGTVAQVQGAVDPESAWQIQIRQGVTAYLDRIEAIPAIALSWIRDLPTLDGVGQSVQRQTLNQLAEMMIDFTKGPGFQRAAIRPITRPLAALLVGGIREVVALALEDGRDAHDSLDTIVAGMIALLNAPDAKSVN